MKINIYSSVILIFGLLFLTCTKTPFGDDDIYSGARQISGTVELYDGANAENVYVWLEGFSIGTYTDENGNFSLTLPSKSSSGNSAGVSGNFSLYFYVANYTLKSALVMIRENEFVYSRGDINKDGKLSAPMVLKRFLRIQTDVSPASVPASHTDPINVNVSLTATDSATVILPKSMGGMLGAILIKSIDSPGGQSYESVPYLMTKAKLLVGSYSKTVSMSFTLIYKPLNSGKYEVVPFILMAHEEIPEALIASITNDIEQFNSNYLNIPFVRQGGAFEVR
ncbi:hypothetical protein H8E88_36010 [candidate division KSB1 bacterium]|nr:hypothetical protein [candidate division KSB1 bacterium]